VTSNKKASKVLYIDYLDYISLFIVIFMKPFYHEIYFHNAIKIFQSKTAIKKLKKLGIIWLSYQQVPIHIWCKSFNNLNRKLADIVLKNAFQKLWFYTILIKYFKLENRGVKIFDATIKNFITRKWMEEGTTSFALIDYYFRHNKTRITYMPRTPGNYLMSREISKKYSPVSIHLIMSGFWFTTKLLCKSIMTVINSLKDYIKKSSTNKFSSTYTINCYDIAFVPHAGLKYGSSFSKTYLYEDKPESIFFKQKLLTLSFNDNNPIAERFYKIHKIPHYNINSQSGRYILSALYNLLKIIKLRSLLRIIKLNDIFENIILIIIYIQIFSYLQQLKIFCNLKLIFFHYDILTSNTFLVACHLRNIKTISHQDRPLASVWSDILIFDHYFILGPDFEKRFVARAHVIDCYHTIGSLRSFYIKNIDKRKYDHLYDIVKYKYLLVCFDTPPLNYFESGLYSDLISEKIIKEFYEDLYTLSKNINNIFILIKPKDISIFDNNIFSTYLNISNKNFKIITDFNKYNSYEMASNADIIIGKHTSILDESFSADKKVIYCDNEGFLENSNYIINDTDFVVKNYTELENKVLDIINHDRYSTKEKIQDIKHKYFYKRKDISSFQLLKKQITKIHLSTIKSI